MNTRKKTINTTLQELGHTLGLNDNDIINAKRTAKSILSIAIAASIIVIIGKITITQLDAIGNYYTGVSIRDFGLLSRFF
jgi:hypothetical protein